MNKPSSINQVAPPPQKLPSISSGLLVVFIIVIVLAIGYFGWNFFNKPQSAQENIGLSSQVPIDTSNPIQNFITYTNFIYSFSLQLPLSWQNYKIKEAQITGSTASYYITIPTTDPMATGDSTADAGYFAPFAISVYTLDQWSAIESEESPKDDVITKTEKYVYTWSHAQWAPADFANESDIQVIISSFKLN